MHTAPFCADILQFITSLQEERRFTIYHLLRVNHQVDFLDRTTASAF